MTSGIEAGPGLAVIVNGLDFGTEAPAVCDVVTTASAGSVTTAPSKSSVTRVGVEVNPAELHALTHAL